MQAKFDILRRHCDKQGRDYNSIEKTNTTAFLIARDEATLKAKQERYGVAGGYRGYALTVPQAIDLVGQYQSIGTQLLIFSTYKNDRETLDLFASDVIGKFA